MRFIATDNNIDYDFEIPDEPLRILKINTIVGKWSFLENKTIFIRKIGLSLGDRSVIRFQYDDDRIGRTDSFFFAHEFLNDIVYVTESKFNKIKAFL